MWCGVVLEALCYTMPGDVRAGAQQWHWHWRQSWAQVREGLQCIVWRGLAVLADDTSEALRLMA